MDTKKKKSNLLTGEDPESAINMKYCEAIKKAQEGGKDNPYREQSKRLIDAERKKKAAKKP